MRTHGSAAELEVKRRIAGRLLLQGKKIAKVAVLVGASWSAVKRWKTAVDAAGLDALASKPYPGKGCRLSARQKVQLVKVLKRGPLKSGYANELWTSPRVADVIERRFGVRYNVRHVTRILAQLGWSSQKPEQRARERDEAAIARWRRYKWPRIKKKQRGWEIPLFSWTKVGSCCNRSAVEPWRREARRPSSPRGTGTSVAQPLVRSRFRRNGRDWPFTTNCCQRTSPRTTWNSS